MGNNRQAKPSQGYKEGDGALKMLPQAISGVLTAAQFEFHSTWCEFWSNDWMLANRNYANLRECSSQWSECSKEMVTSISMNMSW